ncbi:MAG: head GIN domain-containing protein [Flavobacterium sp.]
MKTINIALLLGFILSTSLLQAQWSNEKIKGNGKIVQKNITTSSYESIQVAGAFKVLLTHGKVGDIQIKAEENLLQHIIVETDGNTLKIRAEKNKNLQPSSGKKMEILVPIETLKKISLAGSGDIISEKIIENDKINIQLAGSGDIKVQIQSDEVDIKLSGSGDITVKGTTKKLAAQVAGSGDIHAQDLLAEEAHVKVAGSGDIKVQATEFLEARVAGSGDIRYQGKPKKLDVKTAGSGTIKSF